MQGESSCIAAAVAPKDNATLESQQRYARDKKQLQGADDDARAQGESSYTAAVAVLDHDFAALLRKSRVTAVTNAIPASYETDDDIKEIVRHDR